MRYKKRMVKPEYYDKFKCAAGDCPITCCQEWKISVDERTCKRWKSLTIKDVNCPDVEKGLTDYVTEEDGSQIIALRQDGKCPFLNKKKLCRLVLRYGELVLSETCTVFPRQIHEFEDRVEYSLTACCPVVVDFFREDTIYNEEMLSDTGNPLEEMRKLLIWCMQNPVYTPEKALLMGFYLLLNVKNDFPYSEDELRELSEELDNLDYDLIDTFCEGNELFLDLIENYRKQKIYNDFLQDISRLAEELEEEYPVDEILQDIERFESQFEKYETLFRNYLISELYAQLLLPESDLPEYTKESSNGDYCSWEDMIVAMQWIGMEYAVIRQCLYLRWKIEGEVLTYENVRESIVYVSRMMGYDEADIREYLEECFESLIWEWGYFSLIIGDGRRKK